MSWRSSLPRAAARWLTLVLVIGCGGDTPAEVEAPEDPVVTSLTLSQTSLALTYINQTVPLTATVLDQNGNAMRETITWSSDAENVMTVTATGIVRAIDNGSAVVTATVGNVSGSATVTVQQLATLVTVISGDGQVATAGNTLVDLIVVVAQDQRGSPVEGATVTFTPNPNNGAVSVTSVVVGADGMAETAWTLGPSFGPQRLVASTDGANATLLATAFSDTPTADLVAVDTLRVFRPDPSSLETMTVQGTVSNTGDLASGPYRVQVLAGGAEVASIDLPSLDVGADATVDLEVGPFSAGQQALTLVIDPDGSVLELNEENNEAQKSVFVTAQTSVSTGGFAGLDLAFEEEILYRVDVAPGFAALRVELGGGTGDADVFIQSGSRPDDRTGYVDCVGAGPTNDEVCQILDPEGPYHIILHAPQAAVSNVRMDITLGNAVLPFNLEVVFINNGSPSQDAAMLAAADRWMEVLIGDIPDQIFTFQNPIEANECIQGQPAVTEPVDDVVIYVSITDIDGPFGVLGRARPCFVRHQSRLPINGLIEFDETDLDRIESDGDMSNVILHEMGHVLGIGTLWPERDLLADPSVPPNGVVGADTHFVGVRAIEAFDAAGGVNYTGAKVPVENEAGAGSGDSHWRESVLDRELMTPFIDSGVTNALSAVTVQSLADLGFAVDVSQADAFSLVFAPPLTAAANGGRQIDLRGDIADGPITVVDRYGRIVQIRR